MEHYTIELDDMQYKKSPPACQGIAGIVLSMQLSLNLGAILEGEHQPPIVVGCSFLNHR